MDRLVPKMENIKTEVTDNASIRYSFIKYLFNI